jgi:prolyl oligopeptidase
MRIFPCRRLLGLASVLALGALAPVAAAPLTQPVAPVHNVVDTYQGVPVDDPYRDMEKLDDPSVKEWASGQGQYTRATLDRLPGLAALKNRIKELDAASSDRIIQIQRSEDGQTFFLKRRAQDPTPKLYMRNTAGVERLLFDADTLKAATGKVHTINTYSIAPDARHVALLISKSDAELGYIQVMEVASGKMVGAPVEHIWGELPAIWLPDSKQFVFERSGDPALAYGKNQMFIRTVGSDGKDDRPLLGYQIDSSFKSRDNDWLFLSLPSGSPYAILMANDGVAGLNRLLVQPRTELGQKDTVWRSVTDEADKVRGFAHAGKWLYTRTFAGAPRFRIERRDLSRPDAPAVEVVPQQTGVIEDFAAAKDGLYYVVRAGAVADLFMLPHGAAPASARKVKLALRGSIALANTEPALDGTLFTLEPWTEPMSLLTASLAKPAAVDTRLIHTKGAPFKDVVALETTCPTRDGLKVPISILMKTGLARDGSHPAILSGYAGYGLTETAQFSPTQLAWLEHGGMLAIANPRGSGAYGEDWYQAGRGATKPNTWHDMVDCAEMLIKDGYTSPDKLGVRGVSMGGVAAGRTLTERPDLFRSAIVQVGMLDTVRGIVASQNGPNHLLEMGDVKTEAGIRQLLAMSSYHQVKDGTKYPAVLITAGLHDNRVEPWMSFKMAARLQAATDSGLPVLLRIEEEGGHGISSTADQRIALIADYYAFHLWQTGDPQFQPK